MIRDSMRPHFVGTGLGAVNATFKDVPRHARNSYATSLAESKHMLNVGSSDGRYVRVVPYKAPAQRQMTPDTNESPSSFSWRLAWTRSGYRTADKIPAAPELSYEHNETIAWRPGVRRIGCIGRKIGSITLWSVNGSAEIVHVLRLESNYVFKAEAHKTHSTVYVSSGNATNAVLSRHRRLFEEGGIPPAAYFDTFKVHKDSVPPMKSHMKAIHFVPGQWIDLRGPTRQRGFQGAMKRWSFSGGPASHGSTKFHRKLGSISSRGMRTVKAGTKMAGHMGGVGRVTKALVVKVDTELDLIYVKGSVPGGQNDWISMQDAHHWSLRSGRNKHGVVGLPFPAGTEEFQRSLGDVPKEITLLEPGHGDPSRDT